MNSNENKIFYSINIQKYTDNISIYHKIRLARNITCKTFGSPKNILDTNIVFLNTKLVFILGAKDCFGGVKY